MIITSDKDSKTRIEWIDVARGILIFLVCLGHRIIPSGLKIWIYSFHMPAFFMISGYLTSFNSVTFKSYFKKKVKQLIVPYCALGGVYIVFFTIYDYFYSHELTVLQYLNHFFRGSGIGSTWFIIALFIVEIVAFFLHQLAESWRITLDLIITIAGFYYNSIIDAQPIFNLAAVPVGLFFFEVAWMCKERTNKSIERLFCVAKSTIGGGTSCLIVVIIGSFTSCYFNGKVDMWGTEYRNVGLFIIGAFCGMCLMVYLSCFIVKKTQTLKKVFSYFGRNTLPIIAFHYPLGYMVLETLAYKITGVQYGDNLLSGNLEGFIYAMLIMLLMIPVNEVLNRYIPWTVGKRRSKTS